MRSLCRRCGRYYNGERDFALCPHQPIPTMPSLMVAGTARPASPVSVFAEDFSLLIRTPRRMRIARSVIRVLS